MFGLWWMAFKGFFAARRWLVWAIVVVAIVIATWLATHWIDNWFEAQAFKDQQRIQLAAQLAEANISAQINAASAASLEQQMMVERQRYDELQKQQQAVEDRARRVERELRALRQQLVTDIAADPKGAIARMNATLATIQAQFESKGESK